LNICHRESGSNILHVSSICCDDKRALIIDEPNCPFIRKWQKDFLGRGVQLRQPDTQVLLATHSPEIVGSIRAVYRTPSVVDKENERSGYSGLLRDRLAARDIFFDSFNEVNFYIEDRIKRTYITNPKQTFPGPKDRQILPGGEIKCLAHRNDPANRQMLTGPLHCGQDFDDLLGRISKTKKPLLSRTILHLKLSLEESAIYRSLWRQTQHVSELFGIVWTSISFCRPV